MKYWELEAPGKITLKEKEPSVLKEKHVKVKVEKVLFSASDLEYYNGEATCEYPMVLGRNAVGVISEVYDPSKSLLQKMDRVVIEPYIPCMNCKECDDGDYDKCANLLYMGQNCNGLMQNFVDVSIDQVHHLPENMTNEQALFVSHVAFGLSIVDTLNLEKGRHVAVFASTATGIILAELIAYYQAVPILISNNEELLDGARKLGVFYCVNNEEVDLEREIRTITGGRMCSELVLFSDSDFSFKYVYSAAATNANICLAGFSTKESRITISQICQKHLNIFGVYNGVGNFSSAINLLVTDTVDVSPLYGEEISFNNLDKELEQLKTADLALMTKIVNID